MGSSSAVLSLLMGQGIFSVSCSARGLEELGKACTALMAGSGHSLLEA